MLGTILSHPSEGPYKPFAYLIAAMFSDFHFLSPEWLLALLPLGAILWGIGRRGMGADAWRKVVDPNLLPHLLVEGIHKAGRLPLTLLACGWLAAVVALANPTFERLPVPAYRGELVRLVVLDLSRSMEAADLKPSRLARARYKVADILKRSPDGQVGLIAFAGDAFVVSPLTDDADTILSMLDVVVPEIMPVQGSRPDLALAKAKGLLTQAGAARGEVVLVGDDAGGPHALDQAKALAAAGYSLSVIGVGTQEGAPVPGVRNADKRPVMSRLDADSMRALATAGGGVYAPLSADGRDLDRVLRATPVMPDQAKQETQIQTEVWKELGPWILLGVLPLGALAFRRGWLLTLALLAGSWAWSPEPVMASSWDDLWQRPDQQAAAALEAGEHEKARDLAKQPEQRGTASYRLGDYQAAAEDFAAVDQADAHYNRGNALAKAGRLEEAVSAYERALAQEPGMEDAAYNKALIEDYLKKQQQQERPSQRKGQGGEQGGESEGQQSAEQEAEDPSQADQSAGDESEEGDRLSSGEQEDTGEDQQGGSDAQQQSDSAQRAEGRGEESSRNEEQAQGQELAQESNQDTESPDVPQDQGVAGGGPDERSTDDGDSIEAEAMDVAERAAADYREQAAAQEPAEDGDASQGSTEGQGTEEPTPQEREARQAADQWLRRIPDDPAGLLRRKFLYQYQSRAAQKGAVASGDPW
jgi:Ca-activated chloride channel family protein